MFKKSFWVLFLLAISLYPSAHAEERKFSRKENIDRIIEAQGVKATWEEQVARAREASIQQNQSVLDSLMGNQSLGEEQSACIHGIFDEVLQNEVDKSMISADTMFEIWRKYYGQGLTNGELQELADSYTSDLAKKAVIEERIALEKFSAEINKLRMSKSNDIANQLMYDLGKAFNNPTCFKEEKSNIIESNSSP